MRAVRNIAIVLVLAFVMAEVPAGGHAADGILAALSVTFAALIAATGWMLFRQQRFAYMTLSDRDRGILLGSIGAIVLVIAGRDEVFNWQIGAIVFIGVIALALFGIFRVVMDARAI